MATSELDDVLANRRTDVSLLGYRADDRFDDDALARLAELPIEKLALHRQLIERLPALQPTLRSLSLANDFALASLDGIEHQVGLQALSLVELPKLDVDDAIAALAELPELTELHLGGAFVRAIPPSIAKLPSLISITLEACTELDWAATFEVLGTIPTLRTLAIRLGAPTRLPDAFAPLARLHVLEMRNAGADVAPASLGALVALQKLSLAGCTFAALPPEIGRLQQLEHLNLDGNTMTSLPDALCECAALQHLDTRDVPLKALPEHIGRLARLRYLDVSSKKLKKLPASIGDLAELRTLYLSWSDKLVVPDTIYQLRLEEFIGPPAIEDRLVMRPLPTPEQERITLFEAERLPAEFGDPRDLTLSLRGHVAPIPQLSALRRLHRLVIDTGNLADALARVAHCEPLRELEIRGEHVTLPDELGRLSQLVKLTIDAGSQAFGNQPGVLASLPDTLAGLTGLEMLVVKRHAMTALPDVIGRLTNLRTLVLAVHGIRELPDALGELASLRELVLSSTSALARLPDALARCPQLAEISIWGHSVVRPIENLEVLGRVPTLRSVELQHYRAPIAPLVRALAGGPLEVLDLRYARLGELPAEIGQLAKLHTLQLGGTDLARFPPELRACGALRYIGVPIKTLAPEVRTKIKDHLPPGRWRKGHRGDVTWYERTDV